MIVVVTPNPALDLTWSLPALGRGESHRVDGGHQRAGGKGINVARVLHALGHPVAVIADVAGRALNEAARGSRPRQAECGRAHRVHGRR